MRLDITTVTAAIALATSVVAASTYDQSKLNITSYLYPITKQGTTIFDVARITKRGVCDIGRQNLMADVAMLFNVGESILIPPQVCNLDNETCLLKKTNTTRTCIYGGPCLYYTVGEDTYDRIATRLNITTEALMDYENGTSANETLPTGQFIKVPHAIQVNVPYNHTPSPGIMMLSPTYNYSSLAFAPGGTYPPIGIPIIPINCTAQSNNITVLD